MMYTLPRKCQNCQQMVHPQDVSGHGQRCQGRQQNEPAQRRVEPAFLVDRDHLVPSLQAANNRNHEIFREAMGPGFGNENFMNFFRNNPANQALERKKSARLRRQPELASPIHENSRNASIGPQIGRGSLAAQASNNRANSPQVEQELECYKCGAFGSHQCDYRLCGYCKSYSPGAFFEDHVAVCDTNPRRRRVAPQANHPRRHPANFQNEDGFFAPYSGHQMGPPSHHWVGGTRSRSPIPANRASQRVATHQIEQASNRPQVGSDRRNPDSMSFGSPPVRIGGSNSLRREVRPGSNVYEDEIDSFTSSILNGSPDDDVFTSFRRVISLSHAGHAHHRMVFERLAQILMEGRGSQQQAAQRVSSQQIRTLPVIKFQKKPVVQVGEEEKCPVCCADFEEGEDCKLLPCTHMFHPHCIDTWLMRSVHCPICKRDVTQAV